MTPHQNIEQFEFKGNAKEWFGIWITNVLLSIVTLGIYSAWAKVRTKKYFYQNTYIAGRNFDYHATPKQILIGRLIVVGALVIFYMANAASPALGGILSLVLLAFLPILILRSTRFNARNSSWSNVRFNFDQRTSKAYEVYLLYPILMGITLYTTQPFWARAKNRFGINGHLLGRTRFKFDSGVGPFYLASIAAVVIFAIGFALFFAVSGGPVLLGEDAAEDMRTIVNNPMALAPIGILIMTLAAARVVYDALLRNHVYGHMTLAGHAFRSTVSPLDVLVLTISNMLMVVFSLGLLLPYTQVRMHRYWTENTFVQPNGSIDAFYGEMITDSSAIGDAYSDIEGIDLGIAL